jgi:hypothetical protein
MRASLVLLCVLTIALSCAAQSATQLEQCKRVMDKDIDTNLVPEICSTIIMHLAPGDRVSRVSRDGDFTTTTDGNMKQHWLPGRLQSTIFLDTMRMYYGELEELARKDPKAGIYATPEETDFILNLWPIARDGFCKYHPGETYMELANIGAVCPGNVNRNTDLEDSNSKSTSPPSPSRLQGQIGMCQEPATLTQVRKSGFPAYECRLFGWHQ